MAKAEITSELMNTLLEFIEKHPQGATREEIAKAFMGIDAKAMDQLLTFLAGHGIVRYVVKQK